MIDLDAWTEMRRVEDDLDEARMRGDWRTAAILEIKLRMLIAVACKREDEE